MLHQTDQYVTASGITGWINDAANRTQDSLTAVVVVAGLIVGMVIAVKGRTMGSVIMGVVVGGVICALPFLIPSAGDMAQEELGAMGQTITVPAALSASLTTGH